MITISLGSSCDTANNLKRIGFNHPNTFFDYVWNELNGLKDVTSIIMNDFKNFNDINNYTITNSHPVLNWDSFKINKFYPMFVFMHHDTTSQHVIDSLVRKILRTQRLLESNEMKVFIYYRHYNWKQYRSCSDVNIIVNESSEFCNLYASKYNKNFRLISLLTYEYDEDISTIEKDIAYAGNFETEKLKFDYVYRRSDNNAKLNNFHINSWNRIFTKYDIRT
jgi:hypothetical protein